MLNNKIKIINTDWTDFIILNFDNLSLYRVTKKDDKATFTIKNNILIIKWLNWNEEYFAEYNDLFYKLNNYIRCNTRMNVFQ